MKYKADDLTRKKFKLKNTDVYFNEYHIQSGSVPEGYQRYELESDDGKIISCIRNVADDNFCGTIIALKDSFVYPPHSKKTIVVNEELVPTDEVYKIEDGKFNKQYVKQLTKDDLADL